MDHHHHHHDYHHGSLSPPPIFEVDCRRNKTNNDVVVVIADHDSIADAATICSILCDSYAHNNNNNNNNNNETTPIVRVVADRVDDFLMMISKDSSISSSSSTSSSSIVATSWKCHEKNHVYDRWDTYLGTPDIVLPISKLEEAISGKTTTDDGAMAFSIILCVDLSSTGRTSSSSSSSSSRGQCILHQLMTTITNIIDKQQQQQQHDNYSDRDNNNNNNSNLHLPQFNITYTGCFRELHLCVSSYYYLMKQQHPAPPPHHHRHRHGHDVRRIALGSFAAPLRYTRIVKKGLVLSVPRRTCQQPQFLVTTTCTQKGYNNNNNNDNNNINNACWYKTLCWISPLWRPIIHPIILSPPGLLGGVGLATTASTTKQLVAYSMILQLQDPSSILIFPCLLASYIQQFSITHHHQHQHQHQHLSGGNNDDNYHAAVAVVIRNGATKLVISMVEEIYKLFATILMKVGYVGNNNNNNINDLHHHHLTRYDNLLTDLVGNRTIVELTDNTSEEIIERIIIILLLSSKRRRKLQPIRYKGILEFWIRKMIQKEYDGLTSLSPFPPTTSSLSNSQQPSSSSSVAAAAAAAPRSNKELPFVFLQKFITNNKSMIIESGILQIISCGQILGMKVTDDLSTTIEVLKTLEPYILGGMTSSPYFQIVDKNSIIWNQQQQQQKQEFSQQQQQQKQEEEFHHYYTTTMGPPGGYNNNLLQLQRGFVVPGEYLNHPEVVIHSKL